MPSWGNTDSINDKPHWSEERQVRPFTSLTVNGTVTSGNTIVFAGINGNTAANVGIVAGMYAYGSNVAITGEQEFFTSNNAVKSVSGNTVVLNNNIFGTVLTGATIDFATNIRYNQDTANTYFADTVLVSNSRLPNASFGSANTNSTAHAGWVHVTTGTGGRAGRVQTEVLVALSNTAVANTNSGKTSNTTAYYSGL